MPADLSPHTIVAFNTAAASENRIHDDETAKRFGFTGALVPGVEVYAYMCHMPVSLWGREFLEQGAADCRFFKPVYDGERTTVSGERSTPQQIALRVESQGQRSAEGSASASHGEPAPDISDYPLVTPAAERPPASFEALPEGRVLGIAATVIDEAALDLYLGDVRDDQSLYRDDKLVHPGQILRLCNQALIQNVVLGPWIHVGSRVRNFSAARLGEELTLRARITSNVETKGHAIVTCDAVAVANGSRIVSRIEHVAIWRPRQVAAAA